MRYVRHFRQQHTRECLGEITLFAALILRSCCIAQDVLLRSLFYKQGYLWLDALGARGAVAAVDAECRPQ